jgi:hypothetical protein
MMLRVEAELFRERVERNSYGVLYFPFDKVREIWPA